MSLYLPLYMSISLSVCLDLPPPLCLCLSLPLSMSLPLGVFVSPSPYVSRPLYMSLSSPSRCLCIFPSIRFSLYVCLDLPLSIYLSVFPLGVFVSPPLYMSLSISPSRCLCISPSIRLSTSLYTSLSVSAL